LHIAAENGYHEIIKVLLERGASVENFNVDDGDDQGHTALRIAAFAERPQAVAMLVDGGASTEALDADNRTPLFWSYRYSDTMDTLKALLERYANANAVDPEGEFVLYKAAYMGNKSAVEALLGGKADVNIQNRKGETPLYTALGWGYSEISHMLLNVDGIDIEKADSNRCRPIHLAVKNGDLNILNTLLDRGASASASTKDGKTPLHFADKIGNLDAISVLLSHDANIAAVTGMGETMLHLAANSGNIEALKFLLQHGADVKAKTSDGDSALDLAADLSTIRFLYECGATAEPRNGRKTLLHFAVEAGDLDAINTFLQDGVDVNSTAPDGYTALHLAALSGGIETIDVLLLADAKQEAVTKTGMTALHLAVTAKSHTAINVLLTKKADVNAKTTDGDTALHLAVESGSIEAVDNLLQHGADVNAKTPDGYTPLHLAVMSGDIETLNALLQQDAGMSAATKTGKTTPHLAAEHENMDATNALSQHGVDVNAKTPDGDTALHISIGNIGSRDHTLNNDNYRRGDESIGITLLEEKADINSLGSNGRTDLYSKTWNGEYDSFTRRLTELHPNLELPGGYYGGSLQVAVLNGDQLLVEILLK
jgi:ankyrin